MISRNAVALYVRLPVLLTAWSIEARLLIAQPTVSPPSVGAMIVRVRVPVGYNDSDSSRTLIRRLANGLPPIADSLRHPTSIADVIQGTYHVGAPSGKAPAALPSTYAFLDSTVRSLNDLSPDATTLGAGRVLLPAIPQKASSQWSTSQPKNYLAQELRTTVAPDPARTRFDTIPSLNVNDKHPMVIAVPDPTSPVLSPFTLAAGNDRPTSQYRLIDVVVPSALAPIFLTKAQSLIADGTASVFAQTITFAFGDTTRSDDGGPDPVLPPDVIAAIAQRVTGRKKRSHVPLIIVDATWPDSVSYSFSRQWLRALCDKVRAHWSLGMATHMSAPDPRYIKPKYLHTAEVQESIAALQAAVGQGVVDVVYVPMSADQNAGPLLNEILATESLLASKLDQLSRLDPSTNRDLKKCGYDRNNQHTFAQCSGILTFGDSDTTAARRSAAVIVSSLLPQFPTNPAREDLQSSTAILNGVWHLLEAAAVDDTTGAIVSTSWIVSPVNGGLSLGSILAPPLLLVAAAGNDKIVVNGDKSLVDYARRSREPNVVAVMTMNASARLACHTSYVDTMPSKLEHTNVVGFYGQIANGDCGSSFAAPRVAWLLAADEAMRSWNMSAADWTQDIDDRLRFIRGGASLKSVLLSASKFLDQPNEKLGSTSAP